MSKLDLYTEILGDMRQTYVAKNKDYGDSFGISIEKYGLISALTRISDKFNRIESLILKDDRQVLDEKLEDTLLDLANYCIMTVIELKFEPKENVSGETYAEGYYQNIIDNKNEYIAFLESKVCELEDKLTDEMLKEF